MKRTIEIDEDIYEYLLRSSLSIGESASEILRRLLKLPIKKIFDTGTESKNSATEPPMQTTEILDFIKSGNFQSQGTAIKRFLSILSFLHKTKSKEFEKVLHLSGSNRKYFALSKKELDDSGSNVNPQQIPNSEYWVISNNDTPKKKRMLDDVMRLLGYSSLEIIEAENSLDKKYY